MYFQREVPFTVTHFRQLFHWGFGNSNVADYLPRPRAVITLYNVQYDSTQSLT